MTLQAPNIAQIYGLEGRALVMECELLKTISRSEGGSLGDSPR